MNIAYSNVAHNLKVIRTMRDMTQIDLSEESGVSRITISNVENCNSKRLTLETLIKLASALQVDVADFFAHRV